MEPELDGVARTAEHAARGKHAAVSEGYWSDAHAKHFACGGFDGSPGPLINRGQYARVAAISATCERFLAAARAAGAPAQIVSLGAGFDTCFWQLSAAGIAPRLFVELDQPSIVQRKAAIIRTKTGLHSALQPEGVGCITPTGVRSGGSGYRLYAADLNHLDQLEAALTDAGWRPSEPTLILAECVLCYMKPEASAGIVEWFGTRCKSAVLAAYEMVGPHDAFGRTMLENLHRRGCPLLSLPSVPDVRAQEARCLHGGFTKAEALEMLHYFDEVIGPSERQRVCRLSLLDELEEWRMLMAHYCFVLAIKEEEEEQEADQEAKDDAAGTTNAAAIFGGLQLRTLIEQPPFAASASALQASEELASAAVSISDADALESAAAGARVRSSKAPPLGGPYFDEADEDAVWSDEEEEVSAGGATL